MYSLTSILPLCIMYLQNHKTQTFRERERDPHRMYTSKSNKTILLIVWRKILEAKMEENWKNVPPKIGNTYYYSALAI